MVSIDVNNGTFYKVDVEQDNTKIRVKKGVFAEKLGYNGNKDYHTALTNEQATEVIKQLNAKRAELGFYPLEFYRVKENA
jgi:hypothetical protein